MGVEEDKKQKIVRLIKESANKEEEVAKSPKVMRHKIIRTSNTVQTQGDVRIGGNAGTTFIVNGPLYMGTPLQEPSPALVPVADRPVVIKRINDRQVNQLHKLKDDIVALEPEPDKEEASIVVWRTLNRAMDVDAMQDIPAEKFAHAKNYLTSWLNRLKRERAQEQITDLRAEIIADTVNETLETKVARYIASHWPGQTVETLDDVDALARVKRYLGALTR